ncbi:MAG TPA: hypothetical protein VLF43_03090 [Candidatus Saccharimonadales bacterium]|nr:hypothetical protein [Candidatus Saccharimonadales bacterium]
MNEDVKTMIRIAAKAGMLAKGPGSPQHTPSEAAEAYMRVELQQAFPEDRIVSEEDDDTAQAGRVWIINPSVMIGLRVDGQPTLGCVVTDPNNTIYWGERGNGAYEFLKDGTNRELPSVDTLPGIKELL